MQHYRTYTDLGEEGRFAKDKFFRTLVFTTKSTLLKQETPLSDRTVYQIAYVSTYIVLIGGFVIITGIVILLIIRRNNRKEKARKAAEYF